MTYRISVRWGWLAKKYPLWHCRWATNWRNIARDRQKSLDQARDIIFLLELRVDDLERGDRAERIVRALHDYRWCRCPDDRTMLCQESIDVVHAALIGPGNSGSTPGLPTGGTA